MGTEQSIVQSVPQIISLGNQEIHLHHDHLVVCVYVCAYVCVSLCVCAYVCACVRVAMS